MLKRWDGTLSCRVLRAVISNLDFFPNLIFFPPNGGKLEGFKQKSPPAVEMQSYNYWNTSEFC